MWLTCSSVSVYLLIILDTLLLRTSLQFTQLHFTPLHYTGRHFTSCHLNFTQLHFTTLSYALTPFKFPTAPVHLTSLHFTSLHSTALFHDFRHTSIPFISPLYNYYLHLFTFLLHVSAVLFGHLQAVTSVNTGKICCGRV